jgi:4-hydroxy-tetrahydrodipicolinate synthase
MTTTPTRVRGLVPPVITPLTGECEVDTASLERVVARMVDAGVDGLFALGSSGETVYLTDPQRDLALEVVVKTADGRVPVLAGAIETATARVAGRVHAAERLGADAAVVTAPFYTIVGPVEVERHLRSVAAGTDLPVLAYDIPVCVHSKLGVDLLVRLAHDGVLAGVKDSSGDDVAFRQLLTRLADEEVEHFDALTGHEVMVDSMLLAGAAGSVPGLANVDPEGYVRLHAAVAAGDVVGARREQERLVRLFRIVEASDPATAAGSTRGVGAFKTALAALGVIADNAVSLPMRPLDETESARIRDILDALEVA